MEGPVISVHSKLVLKGKLMRQTLFPVLLSGRYCKLECQSVFFYFCSPNSLIIKSVLCFLHQTLSLFKPITGRKWFSLSIFPLAEAEDGWPSIWHHKLLWTMWVHLQIYQWFFVTAKASLSLEMHRWRKTFIALYYKSCFMFMLMFLACLRIP